MNRIHISATVVLILVSFVNTSRAQEPLPEPRWTSDAGGNSFGVAVARGPDGDPVVTGGTCPAGSCDLRTIKYDSRTGDVVWDISDNGLLLTSSQDDPGGVAVGPDGNVIVVGTGCDGANCSLVAISYTANGGFRWKMNWASLPGRILGADVAIGEGGDAYAVGAVCPTDTDCAMLLLKIDRDNGNIRWSTTMDDGPGFDRGFGVVTADNGDAIVTGSSCQALTELCNFRTSRFAEFDGAIVWTRTADAGGDEERLGELGFDVAIGPDHNPVVSGVVCTVTTNCDFRVVKRNALTGDILWAMSHRTVENGVEQYDGGLGSDVYVDNHGDPVIVGQSCNPDDLADCRSHIFKLRGLGGALAWEMPASGTDSVALQGVTVGLDGNPTVTGFLTAASGETSMRTTKYIVPEETSTGSAVPTSLNGGAAQPGGVSLVFDDVSGAGTTTLQSSPDGPPPPAGFGFMGTPPTYFDIATTATFSGSITICVNFSSFPVNTPPEDLRLFHFENGAWQDVTTSVDAVTQQICGVVTSLSPFAIGEPGSAVRNLGPAFLSIGPGVPGASKLRYDIRVEVYRGGTQLIGAGQLDSVHAIGAVGIGAAKYLVPISATGSYVLPSGSELGVKVLVRNACSGSEESSGPATLLYESDQLGSRFLLKTDTSTTYFLRSGFDLAKQAPRARPAHATLTLGAPCGPFQSFGTWTTTLP